MAELQLQLPSQPDLLPERWLVAVSGGADSVALLRGLLHWQSRFDLQLEVAHFNHELRGEESQAEQQWVQQLCDVLKLPCHQGNHSEMAGIPRISEAHLTGGQKVKPPDSGSSPAGNPSENQLRQLRYAFLQQVAEARQLSVICLAHHAQDQVETLLHRLVRGTNLSGLAGIPQRRSLTPGIEIYRPLLSVSRVQILEYLQEISQGYCHDSSNDNRQYTRNRVRHDLLPLLEQLHPGALQNLLRFQQQMAELADFHEQAAGELLDKALLWRDPRSVRLDRVVLQSVHPVLQRQALVTLWQQQHWPRGGMTATHWHRLQLLLNQATTPLQLPGQIQACQRGNLLILERKTS